MSVNLEINTIRPPLSTDAQGVVRITGTRVTLDTVIDAFNLGATPEEIAQKFPTVSLSAVYSTISYYLVNRTNVDAYLEHRAEQAEVLRAEIERRFPSDGLRERLLARKNVAISNPVSLGLGQSIPELITKGTL